jgi:hypothetical protein
MAASDMAWRFNNTKSPIFDSFLSCALDSIALPSPSYVHLPSGLSAGAFLPSGVGLLLFEIVPEQIGSSFVEHEFHWRVSCGLLTQIR